MDIGKYARALPSLLTLRERGQGPRTLADTVAGTVDLTPLYLLEGREVVVSVANVAPAVGANFYATPMIVPPGELWYVWEYAVDTTPGAGAAIELSPAINLDGQASVPLNVSAAAAATQNVRQASTHPLWATPGSQFGFITKSVTLAPSVVGFAVVTKLKI